MKKFNWKLLLVVVMVLVLVVCVVACNNDKNNNKKPNRPPSGGGNNNKPTYVEQKAFMDELYDVTMGIGNEGSIGTGKDVYLDIDLGIALGTRSAATASDGKKVNLGIALKGIIDRSTETGEKTALEVKLSRTNGTILDLIYVAKDNAMYVEFGGQKTTVNIDLIGLDDILFNGETGLLNKDITLYVKGAKGDTKKGDTVDEAGYKIVNGKRVDGKDPKIFLDEEGYQLKNGERIVKSGSPFTVKGLINAIAATAGDDFTVEKLVAVIVEKLGGLGDIGSMLGTLGFTDKNGNLDIYAALHNDLVCSLVSVPASENTGNNHKAIISLGTNSSGTLGSMLGGMLGTLGLGDKDGLDVGIGFESQNGKLTDGLTISADFTIDKSSPAYEFVEQSGNKDLFPFVELSINSLKFAPADGKSVIEDADKSAYANNYKITIDEHINLKGLLLAGGLASAWPTDIYVYATANLDLKDATVANTTELYAYLKIGHIDTTYREEYLYGAGMPVELSYKAGKLSLRTDAKTMLLEAKGAATLSAYDMLLAKPIGNMIAGLLPADQKEAFMERYWQYQPDAQGENGKFNTNFQGIIVNNLTVKNIVDMIGDAFSAPQGEESAAAAASAAEDGTKLNITTGKGNILTTIMYAIQLIDSEPGKLNLTSKDGLLGTVFKFGTLAMGVSGADWNKEGIVNWLAPTLDDLIGGFTGGMLKAKDLLVFDGISGADTADVFNKVLEENPDALQIKFDFTNGFDFDIVISLHTDPDVAITWNSRIGLGEGAAVQNIKDRLAADKEALDAKLKELQAAATTASNNFTQADTAYKAAATNIAYETAKTAYNSAKSAYTAEEINKNVWLSFSRANKYNASTLMTSLLPTFFPYMLARYRVEELKDNSAKADMDEDYAAMLAYFVDNKYFLADKGEADLKTALDKLYTAYKTAEMGQKADDYDKALKADQASAEYAAKSEAQDKSTKAAAAVKYVQSQIDAYARYLKDDAVANLPELVRNIEEARVKDAAYQKAKQDFVDLADEEQANVKAFKDALQEYYKAYAAAGEKVADDANVKAKKAALDAAKNNLPAAVKTEITDELVNDAATKYAKAITNFYNDRIAEAKEIVKDEFANDAQAAISKLEAYVKAAYKQKDKYNTPDFDESTDSSIKSALDAFNEKVALLNKPVREKLLDKDFLKKVRESYFLYAPYSSANSAITNKLPDASNNKKYMDALETYAKNYWANKNNSELITEAKVTEMKNKLDTALGKLSQELQTAYGKLLNAYLEAYGATNTITATQGTFGATINVTSKLKTAEDAYSKYTFWFEFALAA